MFEKSTSVEFDFARLHDVSKHAIFFLEAFQARYEIIDGLLKVYEPGIDANIKAVELILRHRGHPFKSSRLRLESLERRISKITDMVNYEVRSLKTRSKLTPVVFQRCYTA